MKHQDHILKATAAIICLLSGVAATANTWTLTYELPGVQTTTATFLVSGVEAFDSRTIGSNQVFTTTFGSASLTGTYSGVEVAAASQFGGAGGTGRYAVIPDQSSYTVTLDQNVNYFGYWLSSLDAGNVITFFDGATQVGQFNAGMVFGASVTGNSAYYGNPNAPFLGANSTEPYAFVNFYSSGVGDKFNRIVFSEFRANSGYETDNHTVGLYQGIGGIPVIPEPSTLSLMALGIIGIRLLSGRQKVAS